MRVTSNWTEGETRNERMVQDRTDTSDEKRRVIHESR